MCAHTYIHKHTEFCYLDWQYTPKSHILSNKSSVPGMRNFDSV